MRNRPMTIIQMAKILGHLKEISVAVSIILLTLQPKMNYAAFEAVN